MSFKVHADATVFVADGHGKGGRTMTAHGRMIRCIRSHMEAAALRRVGRIYIIKKLRRAKRYRFRTMEGRRTGRKRIILYGIRRRSPLYGIATVQWRERMRTCLRCLISLTAAKRVQITRFSPRFGPLYDYLVDRKALQITFECVCV